MIEWTSFIQRGEDEERTQELHLKKNVFEKTEKTFKKVQPLTNSYNRFWNERNPFQNFFLN